MKFNKKLSGFSRFSEKEISNVEKLISGELPLEFICFLKEYGGLLLEEDKEMDYYVTIDEKKGIVPFVNFFNYEELILEINHFMEEEDITAIASLSEFIPIAGCHGQYRILIGIRGEYRNSVYLLNVEELKILSLASSIESLINDKIVLENQLTTTL